MNSTLQRLERMDKRIHESGFTTPRGIGSDIPHYVLDYPAEDELQVRLYIKNLHRRTDLNIKEINLFEFLLSFFKDELEELKELSEEEGIDGLVDALETILDEQQTVVESFIEQTEGAEIIFITGVGTACPYIRSSQLLKMLSVNAFRKPIVLFYPGQFTGLRLKMFGILDNEDDYQLSRIS
ncbi:BREX protein BrxB domain-containing protein [Neobacillus niacini]|uniref:BREX protein BrxB domain-containing protein n=1 Tax=Neobacillus niacini TaxID=86668 RepID=UPI002FFD992E